MFGIKQIKKTYRELPVSVKFFIKRATILFVCWLLLYHLILEPIGIPDNQLTQLVLWGTTKVLSLFYASAYYKDAIIYINGHDTISIVSSCNGLEVIVLYWGFLLCVPTTRKRLLWYSLNGFILICVLNVLRCVGLAVMTLNNHPLTDFAHHYAFKLVIYGVIFLLWMSYSKKYRL